MQDPTSRFVTLREITKNYGAVRALAGVDLDLHLGEVIGLAGHNGAGKSTLMQILAGNVRSDGGALHIAEVDEKLSYNVQRALELGIRCVFQELSLCPNLTVVENTRVRHPELKGWGWRSRAKSLIRGTLAEIFPNNDIAPEALVADLTLGQRQMVEIAVVFASASVRPKLVILDEPTSSLDQAAAAHLLNYVRRFADSGGCVILISHILGEILTTCDRVAVMSDGKVTTVRAAAELTKKSLVEAMGHVAQEGTDQAPSPSAFSDAKVVVEVSPLRRHSLKLHARKGEVVGLGGLAGQGQTSLLILLQNSGKGLTFARCEGPVAFVAGDRQTDGVFPLWSIGANITIRSLSKLSRFGLIDTKRESELSSRWKEKIGIRTPDMDNNILTLSGGNQQKALFARALASDAQVILMDDPMRGVDIGTKQEVYRLIRAEAEKGRTFVWYTTEFDELMACDQVYVIRDGAVVSSMPRSEVTESKVLEASFAEIAR